jgi:hypothetical protein
LANCFNGLFDRGKRIVHGNSLVRQPPVLPGFK